MTQLYTAAATEEREATDIRRFRRGLRALEREIGLALEKETDCCDVSAAQCHLLLESEERPGAGLTELADALALDKSTLSRTADSLRLSGFIARETESADRRRAIIRLTDRGKSKVEAINGVCDASYRRLFRYLPEEKRATVVEAVNLLAAAMRKKREDERSSGCADPAKEGRGL